MVAAVGFIPMAITSASAARFKTVATVVIGGIFTNTLLTLLVLPAFTRCSRQDDR